MNYEYRTAAKSRRVLYRESKRVLYRALVRRWGGSREALQRRIRAFLRKRDRTFYLRLLRQQAFAVAVAGALLGCSSERAAPMIPAGPIAPVELSAVATGVGGFGMTGLDEVDWLGASVSGAGDVNGDGLDDVIVGAQGGDPDGRNLAGESYVVFGRFDGSPIDLSAVSSGTGGFVINGAEPNDRAGTSVSGAGDVNGDGLADLIVGASGASPNGNLYSGATYVVFGKADGVAVELSSVAAGVGGFVINGQDAGDSSGGSVSGAGDVNGDGLADLVIGARWASPGGDTYAGRSYVVFGKVDGAAVELTAVASGTGGFLMNGIDERDSSGSSVSGAGDVNGDGLADIVIGADRADLGAGQSYVVFGKADGAVVEMSAIAAGTGGFVINGIAPADKSGLGVSGVGDMNGDGLDDMIIGARGATPGPPFPLPDSRFGAGQSYVLFGKADGTPVELSDIASGVGGFAIDGAYGGDQSGLSVSGAGDVNGDGIVDVIVGAYEAAPGGVGGAGASYVVFGKSDGTTVDLRDVALGVGGFVMNGRNAYDASGTSVSGAGDVNGDGFADVIVGAFRADPGGLDSAGESYVVFSPVPTQGRASSADLEGLR